MIINSPAPGIHVCSIETDAELLQLGEWLGRYHTVTVSGNLW